MGAYSGKDEDAEKRGEVAFLGRIRSIKPEFPQSESVGRLSREARLLFIQLWTLVDDEGRARGASRMLASLLYPYDLDAPTLIEVWLNELESQEHIGRYVVEGHTYLQVTNFLEHQKIDKPSKSKLPHSPKPREESPKPRESSPADQEGDQGEEGRGEDHRIVASPPEPRLESPPGTVDARCLSETVGIFDIRQQEQMHRLLLSFAKSTGKSSEQCIEHMASRWGEYQQVSPSLEWQYGSSYKFFTSGKWDDPRSWPRGKDAQLEHKYTEFLRGA